MAIRVFAKCMLLFASLGLPAASIAQHVEVSSIPLPTKEQEEYLRSPRSGATRGPGPVIATSVVISSVPRDSFFSSSLTGGKMLEQPLQSANEIILLLNPTLTEEQIEAALAEHQLEPLETFPEIGGLVVDASRRLGAGELTTSASSVTEAKSTKLNELIEILSKDERFISVSSNPVISSFVLRAAFEPVRAPPVIGASSERTDWGAADAKFDKIWDQMTGPIKIGVIDAGFAPHEDFDFEQAFPGALERDDHGNHVSGILCAKHNGVGVKGALKNCVVVVSSGMMMLTGNNAVQGRGISPFVAQFSEYIGTVLDFMERRPDVRVINLSLGYNWMPNFGVDPRAPSAENIRNDIKSQGRFFASVLAVAKRKNTAIVMAAGNDSGTLSIPLDAQWASPFNYGSHLIKQADGWTNGLIVEAYDQQHSRAEFSNTGGHVSCPGVDIISTLASSQTAYGEMSGTSMASPYCAAGLAAVLALRPELSLRDAVDCVINGSSRIENRVPRLDIEQAVKRCKKQ